MKKCIYVIDIQATDRYEESLQYLTLLNPAIQKANPEEIIVFFHKYDPDLRTNPEYSDERIRGSLIRPIQEIFVNFRNIQFFRSTIFTIFQKSKII